MPFLGKSPKAVELSNFTTRVKDDLTADGSTTSFTLSKAVGHVNDIEVFVGNVRQEPTDAYTVNGTTLTMSAAPASGVNFYVIHQAGTLESSVVPADDTISTAKISDNAVTSAKIGTLDANLVFGDGRTTPSTGGMVISPTGINTDIVSNGRSANILGTWASLRIHQDAAYQGLRLVGDSSQTADYMTIVNDSGTKHFGVDSNGYVTKPYQPTFRVATGDATQSLNTSATPVVIDFDNVTFDTTSSYNTSTNRYTAPVSGYYYMNAAVMFQSNFTDYNYMWMSFRINGTVHSEGEDMMPRPSGGLFATLSKNEIIYLSSGDYVEVLVAQSAGTSAVIRTGFRRFQGYLLG